jgi:quinol monooxygenase YgiN
MLALIVDLDVHAAHLNQFLDAIEENSLRTFEDEPGCRFFSVSRSAEDPLHFTFYEIYADADAFAQHRNTPHFAQWRAAADVCVVKGSQVNKMTDLLFLRGSR